MKAGTVQFPYLETCGMRKWGMAKDKVGARFEASSCFTVQDVNENYWSQIHRPLEQWDISVKCNVCDKCFCTDSSN